MYLIRLIIYSLIIGVNENYIKQFNKLKFINIIGVIIALIGISQFVFIPDLRFLQYQNWDDHLNRVTFPYLDPSAGAGHSGCPGTSFFHWCNFINFFYLKSY